MERSNPPPSPAAIQDAMQEAVKATIAACPNTGRRYRIVDDAAYERLVRAVATRLAALREEAARLSARVDYYEEAVCMKGNPLVLPVSPATETEAVQVERVAEVLAERDRLREEVRRKDEALEKIRDAWDRVSSENVSDKDEADLRTAMEAIR